MQHFSQSSLKEIEQTKAGQELIELSVEQGFEQGEMLILARLIAPKFSISRKMVLAQLQPFSRAYLEALSEFLWQAETYGEIVAWLTARPTV